MVCGLVLVTERGGPLRQREWVSRMSGLVGMFGHALSCCSAVEGGRREMKGRLGVPVRWDGVGLMNPERCVQVGLAAAEPKRAGCCCVLQAVSRTISAFSGSIPSLLL